MYRHTQAGGLILIPLLLGGVLLLVLAWFFPEGRPGLAGAAAINLVLLGGFGWLTVWLDGEYLRLRFGLGVWWKKFRLAEIREAYPVRNKWWYGWGIRLTPYGWLYNVAGLDAVEIVLSNGKKVRVGTDEPKTLTEAILQAIDR